MQDLTDNYLLKLTLRLAEGLSRLPHETRERHAVYLRAAQNADGGFPGREGGSDLYYTGFALRGLAVLDALTPEICDGAARFLRGRLAQHTSVVDFFSLLYSCLLLHTAGFDVLAQSPADWPDRVADALETFRSPDGGYAKAAGNAAGSTYHTFLVALCYQLLGKPVPRPQEVIRFLTTRQREDGGFVEIGPMRRSGVNPTAAAVGTLQMLNALTPQARDRVADFLTALQSDEGGLLANTRVPLADLLSTFTGTWTLMQLNALDRIDLPGIADFVYGVELPDGGFRGGLWDNRADVEYTFYGLGCLGIVSSQKQ